MFSQSRLTFLLVACALMTSVTGCQTVSLKRTTTQQQRDALSHIVTQATELQHWSIQGKMGIRTEETAHSIQLWWNQQGEDFQLQLTGPFGAGSAKIEGSKAFLTLKTGKDTFLETTPEALFQRLFGWQVPKTLKRLKFLKILRQILKQISKQPLS